MKSEKMRYLASLNHRNLCSHVVALIIIAAAVCLQFQVFPLSYRSVAFADLPPMTLTLTALNDSQLVLNSTAIADLPFYRAYGGYKNQLGNIHGLCNYTGVSFMTLCQLIGGINSSCSVRVRAADNYLATFTYDQIANGNFITYDQAGNPSPHYQSLRVIAAYHKNDQNITLDDGGPLRVAIVGPESLITDSKYWLKWMVELEITWAHDLSVISVSPSRSFAARDFPLIVKSTVTNNGAYLEIFNSTLYGNQTAIDVIQNVAIANSSTATIEFSWNTSGFSEEYHRYIMNVYVWPVQNEKNTVDNIQTDGSVLIVHIGDVTGDAKVDIQDVARVSGAFGSYPGLPKWNPNADVTGDGKVDIQDLARTSANFGWHS